ncbi:MAG: hydroxymethylglutaryl-CoA lyase [Deltaproteobacteria bacterium]|jgi:hydroxymethylglutaryl-CoA lyase|nr:hydroxymethylglutaryl-CoA lyase [Deltaproteobacteria bacterium]
MRAEVLPKIVRIRDITLRDGFQNIKEWIPSETKEEVVDALVAAGVASVEATSFVSPRAIPQLADADRIARYILEKYPRVEVLALVPNMRGAQNAANAGISAVSYNISASEPHNKANINRTQAESLADLAGISGALPDLAINLSMSMVFGCPFIGKIPLDSVLQLTKEACKRGASSVTLCDTIGVANPLQVQALLEVFRAEFPELPLSLHMHDTHGMGLANIFAALQMGVTTFETAAGGLGGCPFAPGAAGNTSSEDALNMLNRMGIATGVDLPKFLEAVAVIKQKIPVPLPGRLAAARPYFEFDF